MFIYEMPPTAIDDNRWGAGLSLQEAVRRVGDYDRAEELLFQYASASREVVLATASRLEVVPHANPLVLFMPPLPNCDTFSLGFAWTYVNGNTFIASPFELPPLDRFRVPGDAASSDPKIVKIKKRS